MPVYLNTYMELDIYKQSTLETPHPTSCESSCVSMRENKKLASGNKYSQWLIARGTLPSLTHTWWCHRKVGQFVWL